MSEQLKKLPPTERLRQHLLDQATAGSGNKDDWTAECTAHAIANGMPWIYGLLRTNDTSVRKLIGEYARKQGFDSLAELKSSLDELRGQLKGELPEDQWVAYFKETDFELK